jgi:hypothetical protein
VKDTLTRFSFPPFGNEFSIAVGQPCPALDVWVTDLILEAPKGEVLRRPEPVFLWVKLSAPPAATESHSSAAPFHQCRAKPSGPFGTVSGRSSSRQRFLTVMPLQRLLSALPFGIGRATDKGHCRSGCGCSSGVEHNLAKVGVEGSNPFARSSVLGRPHVCLSHLSVGVGLCRVLPLVVRANLWENHPNRLTVRVTSHGCSCRVMKMALRLT